MAGTQPVAQSYIIRRCVRLPFFFFSFFLLVSDRQHAHTRTFPWRGVLPEPRPQLNDEMRVVPGPHAGVRHAARPSVSTSATLHHATEQNPIKRHVVHEGRHQEATAWHVWFVGPLRQRYHHVSTRSRHPTTQHGFVPSDVVENSTPAGYVSRSCFSTPVAETQIWPPTRAGEPCKP